MNIFKSIKVLFVCLCMVQSSYAYSFLGFFRSSDNTNENPCPAERVGFRSRALGVVTNVFDSFKCRPLQAVIEEASENQAHTTENFCRIMLRNDAVDACMGSGITAQERREFNERIQAKEDENAAMRLKAVEDNKQTLLDLSETVRLSEAIYSDAEAIANFSVSNGKSYEEGLEIIKSCAADNVPDLLNAQKSCAGGDSSEVEHFNEALNSVEGSCSDAAGSSGVSGYQNCGFIERQNMTTIESVGFPRSNSSGLTGHIVDSSRYYGVLMPEEVRGLYLTSIMTPSGVPSNDFNINTVKEKMHWMVGRMLTRVGTDHSRFKTNEDIFNHVNNLANLPNDESFVSLVNFVNMGESEEIPQDQKFGALSLMSNMSPRVNFSDEGWKDKLLDDKILRASFLSAEEAFNTLGGDNIIKDQETLNKALRDFKLSKINDIVAKCTQVKNDITNNFCRRVPTSAVSEAEVSTMGMGEGRVSREELIDARIHCWNIERERDQDRVAYSHGEGDTTRRNNICNTFNQMTERIFLDEATSGFQSAIELCSQAPVRGEVNPRSGVTRSRYSVEVEEGGEEDTATMAMRALMGEVDRQYEERRRESPERVERNLSDGVGARSVVRGVNSALDNSTIMGRNGARGRQGFIAGTPVEEVIDNTLSELVEQGANDPRTSNNAYYNDLIAMRDKIASLEKRLSDSEDELEEGGSLDPRTGSGNSAISEEIQALKDQLELARQEARDLIKENESAPLREEVAPSTPRVNQAVATTSVVTPTTQVRDVASPAPSFAAPIAAPTGVVTGGVVADVLGPNLSFTTSGVLGSRGVIERTVDQVSDLEQITGYNVNVISEKVAGGNQVVVETENGEKLLCERNEEDESGISCKTLNIVENLTAAESVDVVTPLRVAPDRDVMRKINLDRIMEGGEGIQ